MLRLDHNRALSQLAGKTGRDVSSLKNLVVWGNHSPRCTPTTAPLRPMATTSRTLINDEAWNRDVFLPTVGKRGAAIIEARGLSSAASAANAAIRPHPADWVLGSNGEWVTMGIPSRWLLASQKASSGFRSPPKAVSTRSSGPGNRAEFSRRATHYAQRAARKRDGVKGSAGLIAPRVMQHPNGGVAGLILGEHFCYSPPADKPQEHHQRPNTPTPIVKSCFRASPSPLPAVVTTPAAKYDEGPGRPAKLPARSSASPTAGWRPRRRRDRAHRRMAATGVIMSEDNRFGRVGAASGHHPLPLERDVVYPGCAAWPRSQRLAFTTIPRCAAPPCRQSESRHPGAEERHGIEREIPVPDARRDPRR